MRDRSRSLTSDTIMLASSRRSISRDFKIADAAANIGNGRFHLRRAVGRGAIVDEHLHRPVVFADAVDTAGDVEFGAERHLEEAVEDLGVGERSAARSNGDRRYRRCRCPGWRHRPRQRSRRQSDSGRNIPWRDVKAAKARQTSPNVMIVAL